MLFDPKVKQFRQDISIAVDSDTGLIVRVFDRNNEKERLEDILKPGDVDLRGKVVLPGLVDAHTHVFLHSYQYVPLA